MISSYLGNDRVWTEFAIGYVSIRSTPRAQIRRYGTFYNALWVNGVGVVNGLLLNILDLILPPLMMGAKRCPFVLRSTMASSWCDDDRLSQWLMRSKIIIRLQPKYWNLKTNFQCRLMWNLWYEKTKCFILIFEF